MVVTLDANEKNIESQSDISASEHNIGILNVPTLIVNSDGNIISYNDPAQVFFAEKLTPALSIHNFLSKAVWDKILKSTLSVGFVKDKKSDAIFYFRDMGGYYIIVIETVVLKKERTDALQHEARYIAYLSHHINNPLTVIKNTHELIKYSIGILQPHLNKYIDEHGDKLMGKPNLNDVVAMLSENIHDQGESLKNLEQNMRYLRNIGAIPIGCRVKNLSEIEFFELLQRINRELQYLLKNIKYDVKFSPGIMSLKLRVDVEDFINLFYIIYENSIHSMIRTKNNQENKIVVNVDENREHLILTIENNGHKMSEKELIHCFDPFFSTKSHAEGLGLGLTNALTLARSYEGKIAISNKEESDSGVVYKLYFPKYRVMI